MVILPVIGIGSVLSFGVKKVPKKLLIISLLLSVIFINLSVNNIKIDYSNFDFLHITGFWPIYFSNEINYLLLIMLGFIGVAAGSSKSKTLFLVCVFCLSIFSIIKQQEWHVKRLEYSSVSGMFYYIEDNLEINNCIGISDDFSSTEQYKKDRVGLYKYYLATFNPKKMSYDEWENSDCTIFITPNNNFNTKKFIISREESSGIFVIAKSVNNKNIDDYNGFYENYLTSNNDCVVYLGCFDRSSEELKGFILSGEYDAKRKSIISTDKSGYMFFGPYLPISEGKYELLISADSELEQNIVVEISSAYGSINKPLEIRSTENPNLFKAAFSIESKLPDLEVRFSSKAGSTVEFFDYYIKSR